MRRVGVRSTKARPALRTWDSPCGLFYRKRELNLRFKRTILLHEDGIEVRDSLQGSGRGVLELRPGDNFTTIHMGSSRYFVPHELTEPPPDGFWDSIEPTDLDGGIERTLRVSLHPVGD